MSEFTTEFTDQFGVVWRGTPVGGVPRAPRVRFAAVGRESTDVSRPMRAFEVRLNDRARGHGGWFRRAVSLATDWWVQPVIPRECDCRRCRWARAR